MDQRGRELDSWDELVEKAIDAEAKASLQPAFILREMDQRCPQGNRLADATMAKTQATGTWDPRDKPFASVEDTSNKPEPLLPHSLRSQSSSFQSSRSQSLYSPLLRSHFSRPQKAKNLDKMSRREKKEENRLAQIRGRELGALIYTSRARSNGVRKDLSHITYFKRDKKGHYVDKCPEPKENRDAAED